MKMNLYYLIFIFLVIEKNNGFKPNHQFDRQTTSIFSNRKRKESFMPARYKACNNIKFDLTTGDNIIPEQYFPEMEFPTNIMEASKPYFFKMGESNAILGSFPDDVKTAFKSIKEMNKKTSEEIQTKYINDFVIDTKNCFQDNMFPNTRDEKIAQGTVTVVDNNVDNLLVEEVVYDEISQTEPLIAKEKVMKEIDMSDSTSESDESTEIESVIAEVSESEDSPTEYIVEEEVLAENQFQSWESAQFFSQETKTDEELRENLTDELREGDDLGPLLKTLIGSEEIEETIEGTALLEEPVEVVSEDTEPENSEGEV